MIKIFPAFALMVVLLSSCASSKKTFVPKSNDIFEFSENRNEISILSYNIQTVLGMGSVKTMGLIDYLNESKLNLIAFQEVFDESVREMLVSELDDNHYTSIVSRVDYETFPSYLNQDAGLFMASSLPQIDLTEYEFDDETKHSFGAIHKMLQKNFSVSMDFLANKSVVGSLHALDDSTKIFLFTTHLQAVSSKFHRTYQLEQIYSFIAKSVSRVIK